MRVRSFAIAAFLTALGGLALWLWPATERAPDPPRGAVQEPSTPPATSAKRVYRPEPRVRVFLRRIERALGRARLELERRLLLQRGWRVFPHVVPEDIAWRAHDFLHEVEAAYARRWFAPRERAAYDRALAAWRQTEAHRQRLREDRAFRAAERMLANLVHAPAFDGLHLLAQRAPPFLLVYASEEPLSAWDLPRERRTDEARREVERRQTFARRLLRRNAAVHVAVYDAVKRRLGTPQHLADLGAAYGGRADLPYGVRSFADGVVLVSVTFADPTTARRSRRTWDALDSVLGLQAGSGMLEGLPYVDGEATTAYWAPWYGREAADQLIHWYTRQRNRWRKPRPGQVFVDMGIAAWLGAVQLDAQGRAVWSGVAGPPLSGMQQAERVLQLQGDEYRLLPIRKLLGMTSAGEVNAYAAGALRLGPAEALARYREQAWALAHFLGAEGGAYQAAFVRYLDAVLGREAGGRLAERAFARAFRLQGDDDWRALDEAFAAHVREHLLTMDPQPYLADPPPLAAWDR